MRPVLKRRSAVAAEDAAPAQVRIASKEELAPLSDYVDKEVSSAWLRKSSFETRAFSLVTLNIGAVTLYFALLKGFNLTLVANSFSSRAYFVVILLAATTSIAAAAYSALPADYPALRDADFQEFLTEIYDGKGGDHVLVMLELKIGQLATATRSNQRKAVAIFVSFAAFALLALLLIGALLTDLVSS